MKKCHEDFRFINTPTSQEFKIMEIMQILFLNKHEHLLHFYKNLKVQATEIIHLIYKEFRMKGQIISLKEHGRIIKRRKTSGHDVCFSIAKGVHTARSLHDIKEK